MNIIKIQDQLKGVPDDALIGYVQNPTGQVPTYLALSELQRRKTMRDTYQQDKPAQTTVAEDLAAPAPPMQQAAPTMPADQGVAGLPTGDMYDEQNFATGGIVAFDDGGEVSNYRQDQTALNLNLAGNPSENSKDGNPVNAVTNLLGMARMGGVSPNMGMPGGVNGMGAGNPMGLLGLLGLGKQALQPKSYALNLNSGKQEAQYAEGGEVKNYAKGGTPDEYGIEMPVVPTWDDLKMEQLNAYEQYGVDPEFYAKQAKKLLEERESLKGEKSDAGWMALTRAGLGMAAGTSPFALKNISEGAIQGITQYGADVKDIKTQDRLLKQADMKLSEAQNAQNRGDAQGALKAMEERKNLLLNAQIEKAKIGATIAKTTSSNKRDLFNKARDNAQNAMRDQYGTGGLSAAPFFGDEAKWNAELDRKIDKELKFLASEYNIDPSEIKSISSPAATTTTAKPAATTTAKPAASSTPATKTKPTQADIDYVTAHPELRDKFKARFGIDAPSLVNQIPR
jgi:hypothetical protein